MLDSIIRFSIHNKLVVGILTLALIAVGIYSLSQLPIDAVPDITNNQVQVITTAPTLAAQEVERSITFPVEQAMATLPEIAEIRSISRFGLSLVTIVFHDRVGPLVARQQVFERLSAVASQIPPDVGHPELAPMSTGLGEIYQYTVRPAKGYEQKYSAMELRTIQDWIIRRQLLGTPGVADVSSFGGHLKQYEVALDPDRLNSYGVSIAEVLEALENGNANTGGAYIDKKPNAYFIRGLGLVEGLEDIGSIVIRTTKEGVPLLVRDVAKVQFGHAVRYGAMTRNDEGEVVGAMVLMLKGGNSAQVIRRVKEKMEVIKKSLPEGIVVEAFLDRTHLVNRAIGTVEKNLIEGGLIVVFVLVLFLGNLRAGLVVASVIPLSMLFAVTMMHLFGVSGNLMSLGAIDFGLIVDGAVIIVESVMHRLVLGQVGTRNGVLSRAQMDNEVEQAVVKIRSSAAFGEIIILIVYLPILALVGIEGKMFRPMAETVSFAIAGAFILSLTYVPMASALFLSRKTTHRRNISDRMMAVFERAYRPVLATALHFKAIVVTLALVLLAAAFLVFQSLGGEFIPTLDEGDFALETRVMSGASLSQTVETVSLAAGILKKQFPEVKEVIGKIGASEIPTDPMPIEAADVMVILAERDKWTSADSREELADKMSEALEKAIPGVEFGFQQPIQMRFNELMTGAKQDVAIKIFGDDLEVLAAQAAAAEKAINTVEGVTDVYVEKVTGLPQIQVIYERERLARYGMTVADLNRTLSAAFAGASTGQVFEGEKRFDLVVRLTQSARSDISQVASLFVPLPAGGKVPLSELADVKLEEGAQQISRENANRRITVGFNVRGRDVESVVEQIKPLLDQKLKLPAGYYLTYGGQFENLIEARDRLSIAVPVALLLIFVLLYFTFNSIAQALLIFTAVPLSAIGGVFALWLRGMPFSISAGVGFIALFGVAVLNGIVLIGYFNQLKAEGVADVTERVMRGAVVRLRPVLMTASVAALGFLPMALSGSAGAEVQRPLATVVIGGLVSATLLTLVVLPVLYMLENRWLGRMGRKTGPALLVVFSMLALPNASKAQGQMQQNETLDNLLRELPGRNAAMQSSAYTTQGLQSGIRAANALPRTGVSLLYGQYNGPNIDNNFTVTQQFSLPWTYARRRTLARQELTRQQASANVLRLELERNLKQAYYRLWYFAERSRLLEQQDSLYRALAHAAFARYRAGETTLLEQTNTQAQADLARVAIAQNRRNIEAANAELAAILQSGAGVELPRDSLPLLQRAAIDTALADESPLLAASRSAVQVARAQVATERSELLPDFTLGYFNQSLIGTYEVKGQPRSYSGAHRFQGVQFGVGLPLFYKPVRARIASTSLAMKASEASLQNERLRLNAMLRQTGAGLQREQAALDYYQTTGLKQAAIITRQAQKAFKEGEIGYVEMLQSLRTAFEIRSGYLDAVNTVNQLILELEYLTSK